LIKNILYHLFPGEQEEIVNKTSENHYIF